MCKLADEKGSRMGADFNLGYFCLAVATWAIVTIAATLVTLFLMKSSTIAPRWQAALASLGSVALVLGGLCTVDMMSIFCGEAFEDYPGRRHPLIATLWYLSVANTDPIIPPPGGKPLSNPISGIFVWILISLGVSYAVILFRRTRRTGINSDSVPPT